MWQASAHAQTHRAALVIQHGSSWPGARLVLKCVQFAADTINGLTLLELAGVNSGQPPQVYDWGGGAYSVCQVDREPRQVPDRCFGPTSGPNWSDWSLSRSGWVARSSGTSGYLIHDGDMEGWTYTSAFGAPPPSIGFDQVCASSSAPTGPVAVTHGPAALPTAAPPALSGGTPAPTTSVEALAPWPTPKPDAVLTSTGPPTQPPRATSIGPWLAFGSMALLLLTLGAINLRRRGP